LVDLAPPTGSTVTVAIETNGGLLRLPFRRATRAADRRRPVGASAASTFLPGPSIATDGHCLVETFVDVVPTCQGSGPLYTITTTSNLVEHETVFDNGNVHATFTQTGKFTAVPLDDPSLPSFIGKFTVWGNFNQSGRTVNGTFTFNLQGMGSDGSSVSNHNVEHLNVRPDGSVNEFFHCHLRQDLLAAPPLRAPGTAGPRCITPGRFPLALEAVSSRRSLS
jgi:hypothetical protein